MSQLAIAIVIVEVLLALAVVWGFMHEDFLIAFENRLFAALVQKLRKKSSRGTEKQLLRKESEHSPYAA